MLRLLGRPDPELLEAALEPAHTQAIQERAKEESPDAVLAGAFSICLEAHELWQQLGTRERAQVRGFSLQLLGLAADQTLCLERAIAAHVTLSAEHSLAMARLRELVPRGALLCEQAGRVLERVAGEPKPADDSPAVPNTTFALAESLHRLARAGQELLGSTNVAVRRRALLYGETRHFSTASPRPAWSSPASTRSVPGRGRWKPSRRALDHAQRATFLLVSQNRRRVRRGARLDPRITRFQVLRQERISRATSVRRPFELPPARKAHVVVLKMTAPRRRVRDLGDLDASGVIRKRSKPPLR
jgi:hypothetical protein